jgi:hypothetical protein
VDGAGMSLQRFPRQINGGLTRLGRSAGVAAPAGYLLFDEFTDVDGTLLTNHTIAPTRPAGAVWGVYNAGTANVDIQQNQANQVAPQETYPASLAYVDSGFADAKTSMLWRPGTGSSNGGPVFRVSNFLNCWILLGVRPTQTIAIRERNNGVNTDRASGVFTFTTGQQTLMEGTCKGNTITFTVGGTTTITYTLAAHNNTVTQHGFNPRNGTDKFDDFRLEEAP